ncbi:MAG: pyruvate synthase [Deltaproteobacteria bacterium]|nr:MAG: pyruvate synthase [Deltaproteobacteria bacterium]
MNETVEIRWHGRGGQGTVTAAKVFADACLSSGRYVQAFPEYGPERAGAPLKAYNRISEKELRKHCPVLQPDIVIVADFTLLDGIDVSAGTYERSAFLINAGNIEATKKKLRLKSGQKAYVVDGTRIALCTIGQPLPNSPLVGALAKISGLVEVDIVADDVARSFDKKFPRKIVDGNRNAVKRGWEEVREI